MKLILNTWLAFQTEGAAEAASLAGVLGVEPASLTEALRDNALASPYALAKLNKIVAQDFRPEFSIDLALKDLDLVRTEAGAAAAPIAVAIAERWRELVQHGSSGLDVSAAGRGLGGPSDGRRFRRDLVVDPDPSVHSQRSDDGP